MKFCNSSLLEIAEALDKDGQFDAASKIEESIHRQIDSSMNRSAQIQKPNIPAGLPMNKWTPQQVQQWMAYRERMLNQEANQWGQQQWGQFKQQPKRKDDATRARELFLKLLGDRLYMNPLMPEDRANRTFQMMKQQQQLLDQERRSNSQLRNTRSALSNDWIACHECKGIAEPNGDGTYSCGCGWTCDGRERTIRSGEFGTHEQQGIL